MTQEGIYLDPSRDDDQDALGPVTFSMVIELGNDAMLTLADVARAFAESVNNFTGTSDELQDGDGMKIRDRNGNIVGEWRVRE